MPWLPRTPLLPASQNRAIVPCSTRAWVVQPAPISFIFPEPEQFYLLNSTTPAVGEGCAETWWTSHPPSSIVSSLLSQKKASPQLVGVWRGWGGQHRGKWSLTEGESDWEKSYSEFSTFCFLGFFLQMVFQDRNIWRHCAPPRITKDLKQHHSVALNICTMWKAAPNPNETADSRMDPSVCILSSPKDPPGSGGMEEELDTNIPVRSQSDKPRKKSQSMKSGTTTVFNRTVTMRYQWCLEMPHQAPKWALSA